ncbi:MAG: hypothetical protein HYZ93_02900 [Candidatus Omnitrophica bacterium]|nr:hypothetical protein [Candidatus Omnitrophota bacterium]
MIHKDRIRAYRDATMDQYRIYMREYMRRYRAVIRAQAAPAKSRAEVK